MSFTETSTNPTTSASILLSPSKRRRASPLPEQRSNPTRQELWKWTLTQDAVAPCRVRDVFAMRANDDRGMSNRCCLGNIIFDYSHYYTDVDFFWLGRVPCRSVRVVGLIVGVQAYEKRVVYSGESYTSTWLLGTISCFFNLVDDGTAVIDCVHRPEAPVSPTKPGPKSRPNPQPRRAMGGVALAAPISRIPATPTDPAPTLRPIAFVGTSIKVIGKVNRWHDTRQIRVDSIRMQHLFNSTKSQSD